MYEYCAVEPEKQSCGKCGESFTIMQSIHDDRLTVCPDCGAPIRKVITAPALGRSKSKLDDRAKAAGFSKLKKVDQGTYEKMY